MRPRLGRSNSLRSNAQGSRKCDNATGVSWSAGCTFFNEADRRFISFSWLCIADAVCGADLNPDPPGGSAKQKEIDKYLSVQAAEPVTVSDVRKSAPQAPTPMRFPLSDDEYTANPLQCAGPMFDIDSKNQAVQTSDYADLTSVCADNGGKFPNMGFDCSGSGGKMASNYTKYDANLNKYHRPPGNVVAPIIFKQICNIFCYCPTDDISDFANDWSNVWLDGSPWAETIDGQKVLESMPNGMPYGAGRNNQYELPDMQADVAAGSNFTNVDEINMNATASCNVTAGYCNGDPTLSCKSDTDCIDVGFSGGLPSGNGTCDTSTGYCTNDGAWSCEVDLDCSWDTSSFTNSTMTGNGTCDTNTATCSNDDTLYCEVDADCSWDTSSFTNSTMTGNGTCNMNTATCSNDDTLYCEVDSDCSWGTSVFTSGNFTGNGTCDMSSGYCTNDNTWFCEVDADCSSSDTISCQTDAECSSDGSYYCAVEIGACVDNETMFSNGTTTGNGTCDTNTGYCSNDSTLFCEMDSDCAGYDAVSCQTDADCSTDGSFYCEVDIGVCLDNGTIFSNGNLTGNGTCDTTTRRCSNDGFIDCETDLDCAFDWSSLCTTDADCSNDGTVTCDVLSGECVSDLGNSTLFTTGGNSTSDCELFPEDCGINEGSGFGGGDGADNSTGTTVTVTNGVVEVPASDADGDGTTGTPTTTPKRRKREHVRRKPAAPAPGPAPKALHRRRKLV